MLDANSKKGRPIVDSPVKGLGVGLLLCLAVSCEASHAVSSRPAVVAAPATQGTTSFDTKSPSTSLLSRALAGDAGAQLALGIYYSNAEQHDEALRWLRRSASQGSAHATYLIGLAYDQGSGVKADMVEARKWMMQAARYGDPDAEFAVATYLRFGKGGDKDFPGSFRWLQKAAGHDQIQAMRYLGRMLYVGDEHNGIVKDYENARRWFSKAASLRDAESTYVLGLMTEHGEGGPPDIALAGTLYRTAAEGGYAQAQVALGKMYLDGKGVEKDLQLAEKWLGRAADQGNASAQMTLAATLFLNGNDPQRCVRAARLLSAAAQSGHRQSQILLGLQYFHGRGIPTDLAFAYFLLNIAAVDGDPDTAANRDRVLEGLSVEEVLLAQRWAREWKVGTAWPRPPLHDGKVNPC